MSPSARTSAEIAHLSHASAPVMNFGSEELKRKVVAPVLAGEKFIALAISEAFAGSDVAGLRTTAVKTPDGKHYIVNGTKVREMSSVSVQFTESYPLPEMDQWVLSPYLLSRRLSVC
jgi:hypothetical protein